MKIHCIHEPSYANWILGQTHPTQGRRFSNAVDVLQQLDAEDVIELEVLVGRRASVEELEVVHTPDYIEQIEQDHTCLEWGGEARPDLADLANRFFGGTMEAVSQLRNGAKLVVHLPGAKHHAMADRSSGFCVYADFAAAALTLAKEGHKVAVLDIDAHHGDGTEALTTDNSQVLTFSVHQRGIFPGTGITNLNDHDQKVYNRPLEAGDGDDQLVVAVQEFVDLCQEFKPDYIFVACGGDGHKEDPLASLEFTESGVAIALGLIRTAFCDTGVLFGGAGGYRPDDFTPAMWLSGILALAGKSEVSIRGCDLLTRVRSVTSKG
jgi:acetoin utilization protein AcuC